MRNQTYTKNYSPHTYPPMNHPLPFWQPPNYPSYRSSTPLENKNVDFEIFFYSLSDKHLYPPTFAAKKIFAQNLSPHSPYIEGHTFFQARFFEGTATP